MKKLMAVVLLMFSFGLSTAYAYEADILAKQVRIDTKDYTCSKVVDILRHYRSVWVKGFLGTYGNVGATASDIEMCNGEQSGPRHCNFWTPNLKTKDGTCRVGVRCTCFGENQGRDN